MRCIACDSPLRFLEEMNRKYKESGKYLDLCNSCFSYIADMVTVTERTGESNDGDEEAEVHIVSS